MSFRLMTHLRAVQCANPLILLAWLSVTFPLMCRLTPWGNSPLPCSILMVAPIEALLLIQLCFELRTRHSGSVRSADICLPFACSAAVCLPFACYSAPYSGPYSVYIDGCLCHLTENQNAINSSGEICVLQREPISDIIIQYPEAFAIHLFSFVVCFTVPALRRPFHSDYYILRAGAISGGSRSCTSCKKRKSRRI